MNKKIIMTLTLFVVLSYSALAFNNYTNETKLYWSFDDKDIISGDTYRDLVTGGSYSVVTGWATHGTGRIGQMRYLLNSGSYIQGNTGTVAIDSSDYTWGISINTASNTVFSPTMVLDPIGANMYLQMNDNRYTFCHGGSCVTSNPALQTLSNHVFILKREGNTLSIFVDGVLHNRTTFGSLISSPSMTALTVGNNNAHSNCFSNTWFDEVFFVLHPIPDKEIEFLSCGGNGAVVEVCTFSQQHPFNFVSVAKTTPNTITIMPTDILWEMTAPQSEGDVDCDLYVNKTFDKTFKSSLNYEVFNFSLTYFPNGQIEMYMDCTDTFWSNTSPIYLMTFDVCFPNWECGNWSLCQPTSIRECNLVSDTNNCSQPYTGDYSEFGTPSCCYEDWSPQYGICDINNTQEKYYTDSNSCGTTEGLPFDNGTMVVCNVCDPSIEFVEEQCIYNGTSYYTTTYYRDNNYYSCCVITGDDDDCIVDTTPYNITNQSLCVDALDDFELQIDENVFLSSYLRDDKVFATIWMNDTTQVYTCQSYVKTLDGYGIKDKRVIQINPIYQPKKESFLTLDSREYEDRDFFVTSKGQAVVYYTDENIIVDGRPYLFGVECVGNLTGTKLTSERVAYIRYAFVNEPITRTFWIKENMSAIVYTILVLLVLFILLGAYKRSLKGVV